MTTVYRQGSLLKAQYTHAIFSTVQIDGTQESLAPLNTPDPWIMQPPAPIGYDFNSERRVLEHIQERQAMEESEIEARITRQEESRKRREQMEKEAAERAEHERRQAELRKKLAEEEKLAQQQRVMEQLNADQQRILRQFDNIVGTDSDVLVRIAFLQRFKFDLEITVAAFFEFEGDLQKIPPASVAMQPSPATSPSSGKTLIQFVFPNGSTEVAEFKFTDTLWIVFTWVYSRAEKFSGQNGFSLKTADGRYAFKETDYDQTLEALRLTPRGIIRIAGE